MLFFLHIPKGGGTTLNSVLDNNFQLEEFYQGYNLINKFEKQENFVNTFNHLPPVRKNRIKVIRSHFYFGLHRELKIENFNYISLVRDPVDRFISDYYFIRENESHLLHDPVMSMSFKEYLKSEAAQFSGNLQTRMIAGQQKRYCSPEDLEQAKANIKKNFSLVGLLERFDETLVLLKIKNILNQICYVKQNITPQRMTREDIPTHLVKAIEKINRCDILLYRWIQERFIEEVNQAGSSFEQELQQFLALNRENVDPDFDKGYRYFRQGQWEQSRTHLEKSIKSKSTTAESLEIKARANFYLGEIHRHKNSGNQNQYYRKSLEIILKRETIGTNNTYMIGSLYERLGEYEKARKWFRRIVDCFLQGTIMGNACFHLGEIHLKQGEIREAKHMFQKTLKYNHVHKKAQNYLETLK